MFRVIGNEIKNQPIGSLGAIAGIISLFLTITAIPSSLDGNLVASYNVRLLFGLLISISAAYGFLFIAHLLLRSQNLAVELSSFIFIFLAALSIKLVFTEIFLKTAWTVLDANVYSDTEELMAIFAVVLGSIISAILFDPCLKKYFRKHNKLGSVEDDRAVAYLVLVPIVFIIWISAFYFPLN